jgi:DNA-binding transcriptional MerR regulator
VEVTWTIAELAERAAGVLAATQPTDTPSADTGPAPDAAVPRANGRVRDVPNERLIRWYATVGLVDPPLTRKGRVARYGQRHLLQLVAVKRRQAEGRSLAEIQEELAGATDEALAAVAAIPDRGESVPDASGAALSAVSPAAPARFWARPPSPPSPAISPGAPEPAADRPGYGSPGLVHGLRLAPGVVLLLEGADHEPGPDDVTEILNAAQPLLRALADRALSARME